MLVTHLYREGSIWTYRRDGFGDVCSRLDELIDSLEALLIKGGEPKSIYLDRVDRFFKFSDGRNSKRVIDAIFNLESCAISNSLDIDVLKRDGRYRMGNLRSGEQ